MTKTEPKSETNGKEWTREEARKFREERRQKCFAAVKDVLNEHGCVLQTRPIINEQGQILAEVDIVPMD